MGNTLEICPLQLSDPHYSIPNHSHHLQTAPPPDIPKHESKHYLHCICITLGIISWKYSGDAQAMCEQYTNSYKGPSKHSRIRISEELPSVDTKGQF